MAALDALVKDGLPLVCATHLPRLVVHLLAVTLGAVFLHHYLRDFLLLLFGLGVLHPLLPLCQLLLRDDLRIDEVPQLRLVSAEAARRHGRVGFQGKHHSTVRAEDG